MWAALSIYLCGDKAALEFSWGHLLALHISVLALTLRL